MKIQYLATSMLFSACASTAPMDNLPVPADVAAQLFKDPEMVQYVCAEPACTVDEFAAQLHATPAQLRPSDRSRSAVEIRPARMGHIFPTALFVPEGQGWRMVFAPNVSSRGVSRLSAVRNGYYMLREHEPSSATEFSDTDYIYDSRKKSFKPLTTRCFSVAEKGIERRSCK